MFEYIKDGINPRGPEYGATDRAANAAQRNADATLDLLELQLADPRDRPEVASRINARRAAQDRRRKFWTNVNWIATTALIAGIAVYMLTPSSNSPQSAVTQDTPSSVQTLVDDTPAPTRSARAPNKAGSYESATDAARRTKLLNEAANGRHLSEAEYDDAMTIPGQTYDPECADPSNPYDTYCHPKHKMR